MIRKFFIFAMLTAGISFAQDIAPSTAQEVQETIERSVEFAGGSLTYASEFPVHIVENSNATMYSTSVHRRESESTLITDDSSMGVLRITQTIYPMAQLGTIEALLEATITDAKDSITAMNNAVEIPEPTDITRTIQGVERTGKQLEINLYSNGQTGKVQCFAFVDSSGHGVGITIKFRDGQSGEVSPDETIINDFLADLTINKLTKDSSYTYLLSGYPVKLPVISRVDSVETPDASSVQAQISLDGVSLTLMLTNVPDGYDIEDSVDNQLKLYDDQILNQVTSGLATQSWSTITHVPIGNRGQEHVKGDVYMLNSGDNQFFNTLYGHYHERVMILANFTIVTPKTTHVPVESIARIHETAKLLFGHMPTNRVHSDTHHYFPGFNFVRPSGYHAWPDRFYGRQNTIWIAPYSGHSLKQRLNRIVKRQPITRLRFSAPGESITLPSTHKALVEDIMNRHRGDKPEEHYTGDLTVDNFSLPNGPLIQRISTSFLPELDSATFTDIGMTDWHLTVTSYLIPNLKNGSFCVASTVSNSLMHPAADDLTHRIIERLQPQDTLGKTDMRFATFIHDPFDGSLTRHSASFDDSITYSYENEKEWIRVVLSHPDDDIKVLSRNRLASAYMNTQWRYHSYSDEFEKHPINSESLKKTTFAGLNADLFEVRLDPNPENEKSNRTISRHLRMFGFVHNDRYITVTMYQEGEHIDTDRLDAWAESFVP